MDRPYRVTIRWITWFCRRALGTVCAVSTTTSSTPDDRSPALLRPAFYCPHCPALAHHDWVALGYQDGNYWASMAYVDEPDPAGSSMKVRTHRWHGAQCHGCREWSIWLDDRMVFPQRSAGSPAHVDMPGPVRELYKEAAAVVAVSRRAGAALARATIERLVKELDPEAPRNARLDQRIGRLRERVSTPLGQLLDVVRVVGNGALHADEQSSELLVIALDDTTGPELIELLLQVANDLVDELITRPRTAREYWDRLPDGVKTTLAQQDATAPVPGDRE
jgi:hypothetical protein